MALPITPTIPTAAELTQTSTTISPEYRSAHNQAVALVPKPGTATPSMGSNSAELAAENAERQKNLKLYLDTFKTPDFDSKAWEQTRFREMYGTEASRRDQKRFNRYMKSDEGIQSRNLAERTHNDDQQSRNTEKFSSLITEGTQAVAAQQAAAKAKAEEDARIAAEKQAEADRIAAQQDLNQRIAGSSRFNDAFRMARQAGLKTFTWKGNLYGTKLASEVKPAAEVKPVTAESSDTTSSFTKLVDDAKAETTAQAAKAASARVASSAPSMPRTPIKTNPAMTEDQILQQEAAMQKRRDRLKMIAGDAPFYNALKLARKEKMNTFNWRGRDYATQLPEMWTPSWTSPLNISIIPTNKVGGRINYFQQGGTASSAQQEQANAFMQAILQGDSEAIGQLIQAANQGDKQATQLIETILKEDLKGNQQVTKAAAVIKQLLSQTVLAKWGAKLEYMKSLKYAKGGKTCPACEQKVEMKKCGGKKAKKRYFGGLI